MCYRMRKLLYIPCSQDGFLPSCYSPLSCSGLPPLHNNMLDSTSQLIQCTIRAPEFQWFFVAWSYGFTIPARFSTKAGYSGVKNRIFSAKTAPEVFFSEKFRAPAKALRRLPKSHACDPREQPLLLYNHASCQLIFLEYASIMQRLPGVFSICKDRIRRFLSFSVFEMKIGVFRALPAWETCENVRYFYY